MKKRKVILCSCNNNNLPELKRQLEKTFDCEVEICARPDELLQRVFISGKQVKAIVVNPEMPMNIKLSGGMPFSKFLALGYQTLATIKDQFPHIKIVMIGKKSDHAIPIKALGVNGNEFWDYSVSFDFEINTVLAMLYRTLKVTEQQKHQAPIQQIAM